MSQKTIVLDFVSFGWDNGPPPDTHDKRYKLHSLPNPAHSLRAGGKTGQNKDLQDDWFGIEQVISFHDKLVCEIQELINGVIFSHTQNEKESEKVQSIDGEHGSSEDASPLVICVQVGCAKGKHRSVAMVERLSKHQWEVFKGFEVEVTVTHRDLQKQSVKENKRTKMDKRNKDRSSKFQRGGDAW